MKHALESAEFFTRELATLREKMLGHIDQLNVSIDKLTGVIETLSEPHETFARRIPATASS